MNPHNKLIIWCGDSWTNGVGLGADKKKLRFSSEASRIAGADCINLSVPGSSIGHLVYKLQQIKKKYHRFNYEKKLVLFGLTVPYRLCIANEYRGLTTVSVNDFDICGYKNWAHYIFNNRHILDDTCIKLSWISEQCKKHQINFGFYNILCNSVDFDKSKFSNCLDYSQWLVDSKWSLYSELAGIDELDFSKVGILEKTSFGKKFVKEYILDDGHPNEKGHHKIGQALGKAVCQRFELTK